MGNYERHAVYVTATGALAEFGASWLGWDNAVGEEIAHPKVAGLDVEAITATPRKYGFHGTIKPPFRLALGTDAQGLAAKLEMLCGTLAPVSLDGLHLARLGHFLALVPVGDTTELAILAAQAVEQLDDFRAPPTEAELTRRRKSGLSERQEEHLARWGYPYVMDQFRYHMTLTGPLDPDLGEKAEAAIAPLVTPVLPRPYIVDALTLLGEASDGRFHQIQRFALTG